LKTLRSRGHRVLLAVLVEVRRKGGLTQTELGGRLKWPQSRVAKVEGGERRIDPVECAAWAKACGITPRAFFLLFSRTLERTG
jgi:transcriptional regulator with XRE-family HTH domain